MSCRTNRGTSALLSIYRGITGLEDAQLISLFHRYSHAVPSDFEITSESAIDRLEYFRSNLMNEANFTPRRRTSISQRIDNAISDIRTGRNVPSASIVYAWDSLGRAITNAQGELQDITRRYGGENGLDRFTEYVRLYSHRENTQHSLTRPPRDFRDNIYRYFPNLPSDRRTEWALYALACEDNSINVPESLSCLNCHRFAAPNHVCESTETPQQLDNTINGTSNSVNNENILNTRNSRPRCLEPMRQNRVCNLRHGHPGPHQSREPRRSTSSESTEALEQLANTTTDEETNLVLSPYPPDQISSTAGLHLLNQQIRSITCLSEDSLHECITYDSDEISSIEYSPNANRLSITGILFPNSHVFENFSYEDYRNLRGFSLDRIYTTLGYRLVRDSFAVRHSLILSNIEYNFAERTLKITMCDGNVRIYRSISEDTYRRLCVAEFHNDATGLLLVTELNNNAIDIDSDLSTGITDNNNNETTNNNIDTNTDIDVDTENTTPSSSIYNEHCMRCGQYVGETLHRCPDNHRPPYPVSLRRYSYRTNSGDIVSAPAESALRQFLIPRNAPVLISAWRGRGYFLGLFWASLNENHIIITPYYNSDNYPRVCGLHNYVEDIPCGDRIELATDLETRYNRIGQSTRSNARRSGYQRLQTDRTSSRPRSLSQILDRRLIFEEESRNSTSYLANNSRFQEVYNAAKNRRNNNEQVIPYIYNNATGGLGARNGGRPFGVEIEIDDVNQEQIQHIITDMRSSGLTTQTRIGSYHAARTRGYNDVRNSWSIEYDSSVAAEIVSPILYDETFTWEDIEKVCDIVKRYDGRVSERTGCHVHVGIGNSRYIDPDMFNRILDTFSAHEDEFYRLAQNPAFASHRGLHYCAPNPVQPGYRTVNLSSIRTQNSSHSFAINMSAVNTADSHIEYRLWDGSLEPSVIQTQVKLSLGLTDYGYRTVGDVTNTPFFFDQHPYGTTATIINGVSQTGEAWQNITFRFRRLVDILFSRNIDKEQATSLFAVTKFQRRR